MREQEDSPLEDLKKRLYTTPPVDGVSRGPAPAPQASVPEGWKGEPLKEAIAGPKVSGSTIFLIGAAGFFVLAGIVSAAVLFLGGRLVSADQLQITVEGPTTVSGGESVSLFVTVHNNNPTVASDATLTVDFPEGTFSAEDAASPLAHTTLTLGDIAAGETVRKTITAAFFGEENQRVTIPVSVEYTTGNSNATFVSKGTHALTISTAPVTLAVSALSEVSSGQPQTIVVRARSNATTALSYVAVRADYPFGFIPTSETPTPSGDVFVLDSLLPGEEKEIRITGSLSGQDGEERAFTFTAGSLKSPEGIEFGAPYSSKQIIVTIAKPFLSVGLSVNRANEDPIIIKAGELASTLVSWENQLQASILDGRISVALLGDALDPLSVNATNGFYRSIDRTVLFDRDSEQGLKTLEPGDRGNGSFVFKTKTGSAMASLRNPSIAMTVSVSGRRVGGGNVTETITSSLTRTIKIETDLSIHARAVRTEGPFENSGPWPPITDTETTYTVLLTAANTVNTVANASVKTTLPSYVRFTGLATPPGSLKYNEATREVVWTLGDMAPGTSKEAVFQVAFLPSTSQKGASPALTSEVLISGHDRFVERETTGKSSPVTIQARTDPSYVDSYGIVK